MPAAPGCASYNQARSRSPASQEQFDASVPVAAGVMTAAHERGTRRSTRAAVVVVTVRYFTVVAAGQVRSAKQ
jgi:hypothetical protein